MLWVNFLHIYQPPNQMPDILAKVVNECYRPLFSGLAKIKGAKLVLNINAVLTEMLYLQNYRDVLETIKQMAQSGQLEFTESAKFHAFLPLLPKREIERQIILNRETNRQYFGDVYQPHGFFPPEMGYSREMAEVVSSLGYEWIILDEIAYKGGVDQVSFTKNYRITDLDLGVCFRERRTSNLIMGAVIRSGQSLLKSLQTEISSHRYLLTAMDGETFGHHRPGLENVLFDLYRDKKLPSLLASDLKRAFPQVEIVDPVACSWASSEKDLVDSLPYKLWNDSQNPIHRWKWQMTNLALAEIEKSLSLEKSERKPSYQWRKAREILDMALNSCHYWWASPYGWWSLEMVEAGSYQMLKAIESIPGANQFVSDRAKKLYERIVFKAFEWQRTGYIRSVYSERESWRKIPFRDRVNSSQFNVVTAALKKEENLATSRGEYEQAIRWRDGRRKLELGTDVYDAIHIVDQLRAEGRLPELSPIIKKYRREYRQQVPGQEL